MHRIFRLSGSRKRDPAISTWMHGHPGVLGAIASQWFDVIRGCGEDVSELMHDGCPTACVADAAFAYVGVYQAHVTVGFFHGAELDDPAGLLEGAGKYMRHVKLRPAGNVDAGALVTLIEAAHADITRRLRDL